MKQERRKPTESKPSTIERFEFGSGQSYAKASDFAADGTSFAILGIVFEPNRGYEDQDRWSITIKPVDREAAILTLGSNPRRDEELRAAQAHLERGGKLINIRLHRSGKAFYFVNGDR